jgi:hypothetical protein
MYIISVYTSKNSIQDFTILKTPYLIVSLPELPKIHSAIFLPENKRIIVYHISWDLSEVTTGSILEAIPVRVYGELV